MLMQTKWRTWSLSLQATDNPLEWKFSRGPLKDQSMLKIDPDSGCWIWQGGKNRGYGKIQIMARLFPGIRLGCKSKDRDGWLFLWIHQLTYFMKYGNPPRGKELDHTCLRRCCANPDHVEAKTPAENRAMRFMMPELTDSELDAITEKLLEKYPNNWIASNFGVSVWVVRRIAERMKVQTELPLEVPF